MISIESSAKTVQKAIEDGLQRLSKTIDEVDIKIISSGGLFKKARVEISVIETEKPVREVRENRNEVRNNEVRETCNNESRGSDEQEGARENKGGDGRAVKQDSASKREGEPAVQYRPKEQTRDRDNRDIKGARDGKEQTQKEPQARQKAPQREPKEQQAQQREPQGDRRENRQPAAAQDRQQNRPQLQDRTTQEKAPFEKRRHNQDGAQKPAGNAERFDREKMKSVEKQGVDRDEHREGGDKELRTSERMREHREGEERHERPRTPVTDEIVVQANAFVQKLLSKMNIDFALKSEVKEGELNINIECGNGAVIGYRGEALDSIEYLTSLAINKCDDKYFRINVDCNDYRTKRVETLSALARRMAEKAIKTGRKVVLEPMSSSSRKIIHSILSENDRIITKSEGKEPTRRIIIIPKRFK